jgi:hypothetical protein
VTKPVLVVEKYGDVSGKEKETDELDCKVKFKTSGLMDA